MRRGPLDPAALVALFAGSFSVWSGLLWRSWPSAVLGLGVVAGAAARMMTRRPASDVDPADMIIAQLPPRPTEGDTVVVDGMLVDHNGEIVSTAHGQSVHDELDEVAARFAALVARDDVDTASVIAAVQRITVAAGGAR